MPQPFYFPEQKQDHQEWCIYAVLCTESKTFSLFCKDRKWNWKCRFACDRAQHPSWKTPVDSTVMGMQESRPSRQTGGQSNSHKWPVSWNTQKLRSLRHYTYKTKLRTSHHQSPRGERRRQRQQLTIYLERMRDDHCQSDRHWNCFKGTLGKLLINGLERIWALRYLLELY